MDKEYKRSTFDWLPVKLRQTKCR